MLEKIIDFIKNLFNSKKVEQKIESNNSPGSINIIGKNNKVSKGPKITTEKENNDEVTLVIDTEKK